MKKASLIYALILCLSFLASYLLEIKYQYNDIKDYHGILVNFSGMIFTIMGIWIAFLYPNALLKIVNPEKIETADFTSTLEDTKRLESIVASVLKSLLVVTIIAIFSLSKIVFYKMNFVIDNLETFKCLALSITLTITVMQLEAVFQVFISNVAFINNLHNKREEREANENF